MSILTQIVVWLNAAANAFGQVFVFIGFLPGWLSATIIAVLSGIAMLIAFKYTSNQRAIKRARQDIRANLLAVKLFHDSLLVGFRAQGRVLLAALRLLVLAIVPILVMIVPMALFLGQLAPWYQARPLRIGEEAVITLKLRGESDAPWPVVILEQNEAIQDTHGPVRIFSQREICWNIRAQEEGCRGLVFRVGSESVAKELAVGDRLMRVSTRRPDWDWSDALLHPREAPFGPESAVQSIEVQYPTRSSWTSGADSWVYYWLAVALMTGFCCRGLFKVYL
jgi:hypothetical protein